KLDGRTGWCEENHRCSLEDTSGNCLSKRRYAPFGTGEGCVPPAPTCAIAGLTAGTNFNCVWSNLGHVACWGENGNGQLGDTTQLSRSAPVRVALTKVVELAAGAIHACARHDDGSVSCWGDNAAGQLGLADGSAGTRNAP